MLDFLARILRNNTPRRDDWLGRHRNAREVGSVEKNGGYSITYRDGNEFAKYETDELGNVTQVSVVQL